MLNIKVESQLALNRLSPTDKSIILTMIEHAVEFYDALNFKTKVSHQELARVAGVSTRTIARHIDALGIITKHRRRGRGNPTVHLVNLKPIMPISGYSAHVFTTPEIVHSNGQITPNQADSPIRPQAVNSSPQALIDQADSGMSGHDSETLPPHVHLYGEGYANQPDRPITGQLTRARGMNLYLESSLSDPKEDLEDKYIDQTPNAVPEPCQFFHDTVLCEHVKGACSRLQRVIDPPTAVTPNANLHHFVHQHSVNDAVMLAMYLTRHGHSPGYIANGAFNPRQAMKWLVAAREEIPLGEAPPPQESRAKEPEMPRYAPRPACHRVFDDDDEAQRRADRDANIERLARLERARKREEQQHCAHEYAVKLDGGHWVCRACDKQFTPEEAILYELKE